MKAGRQSGDSIESQTLRQTLADLVFFFFPISVDPSSRKPATFALFKGGKKSKQKPRLVQWRKKRETSPPVNTQHPISDQTPNWTEVTNKLREQVTLGQNKEKKNSPYLFWMHQNYKVRRRKKARQFRDTPAVRTSKATRVATVPDQACRFQSHMAAPHASQYRHHIVPTNIGNSPHVPHGLQPPPPPAKDGANVTLASQKQRENRKRSGRSRGGRAEPMPLPPGPRGTGVVREKIHAAAHTGERERWRYAETGEEPSRVRQV